MINILLHPFDTSATNRVAKIGLRISVKIKQTRGSDILSTSTDTPSFPTALWFFKVPTAKNLNHNILEGNQIFIIIVNFFKTLYKVLGGWKFNNSCKFDEFCSTYPQEL